MRGVLKIFKTIRLLTGGSVLNRQKSGVPWNFECHSGGIPETGWFSDVFCSG